MKLRRIFATLVLAGVAALGLSGCATYTTHHAAVVAVYTPSNVNDGYMTVDVRDASGETSSWNCWTGYCGKMKAGDQITYDTSDSENDKDKMLNTRILSSGNPPTTNQ